MQELIAALKIIVFKSETAAIVKNLVFENLHTAFGIL
jgi:hypothetical protein